MFGSRALSAVCSSLNLTHTAECDSHDKPIKPSYHKFIEPQLKPFINRTIIKSHYNFIHDSLPYRTSNNQQLQLYDDYMNDVLSFNNIDQWKRITKCLNNDKTDPSKQLLCKSLLTDYHIANEDIESAQTTIKDAYDSFTKHDELSLHHREELYVLAFYEWIINFDLKAAQHIFRYISKQYPFDLFAAKRTQEMSFELSDWQTMLDVFIDIEPYHGVDGIKNPVKINGHRVPSAYYNGLISFSYEQMGNLNIAEQYAMEGLEYYIDDNWLQHSLIHSRYFQKNSRNDLKRLIRYIITNGSKYWDIKKKHAFMTTHNWWHIALLYLELNDLDEAMNIFRNHIWRENLDRRADQIGALSMFWILNMIIDCKQEDDNGKYMEIKNEIGIMWETVMDYVFDTNKNVSVGYKLYDVLFIRGVIEMKARYYNKDLDKYTEFDECFNKLRKEMIEFCGDDEELKNKYIGIVDAMLLMYGENANKKNWNKAYEILSLIIHDLNVIGGSREQRFVFDQMFIDLLIKNNQKEPLKQYLESFLSKYPIKSLEVLAGTK